MAKISELAFMTTPQFLFSIWFAIYLQHVWFPSELCEKILKTVSASLFGYFSFKLLNEAKKAYGILTMLAQMQYTLQQILMSYK